MNEKPKLISSRRTIVITPQAPFDVIVNAPIKSIKPVKKMTGGQLTSVIVGGIVAGAVLVGLIIAFVLWLN
jgi:hypothetical protein